MTDAMDAVILAFGFIPFVWVLLSIYSAIESFILTLRKKRRDDPK